jgi:hypothetical protein
MLWCLIVINHLKLTNAACLSRMLTFILLNMEVYIYRLYYCPLPLCLLMSYTYEVPCKARNFNVVYTVYMNIRLATLKAASLYLLHNVSALNQCRKLSCGTVVCVNTLLATKVTLITDGI